MSYLPVTVQGGEVEEERLSQRDGVDGVIHVVAAVELHLSGRRGRQTVRTLPVGKLHPTLQESATTTVYTDTRRAKHLCLSDAFIQSNLQ